MRQRNTHQETTIFARGAYPSNLWQKNLDKAELFSYECNWQVDGEDIEDGQKDGEDVIVQNFDDEQTSDETDSSSSSEKD